MSSITKQFDEIQQLYFVGLEQCSTAGEKVKVFQKIQRLHVCLKRKISNNKAFNEITQYLQGKTSCMNLCGGVCENICHLNAQEFNQYIKRNNLTGKLIMTSMQSFS
ncbi:hypothetical protein ACMAZF_20335 (plasmid) [Psychrobium sp. nBUS_13]|uniref:hypothetical protein n=1 Tax=Psychrobium sp. nBUS_13 TaxID=3395319 RepID=UPI003EB8DACC